MNKQRLFDSVEEDRDRLENLSQQIWETPELPQEEYESAEILIAELEQEGFEVETGIGGLPTAFVATYDNGGPKIGMLGEYDALPGLSQQVTAEREPVEEGAPGHGCGHNLYCVGSLGGAIAVKRAIERDDLDGSVAYYGCPAEETLVGKAYMARDGAFDDLDAALRWHPAELTTPTVAKSNAMNSVEYSFDGVSSHPATTPESGRSALDAVQLLNMAAEFMREHISNDARIHYTIVDGGDQPNVIPSEATVWYYVRAPSRTEVDAIQSWLDDAAQGAALMTQTEVDRTFLTGVYDRLPNESITEVIWENMQAVGPIEFTDDDREFAESLQETVPESTFESQLKVGAPDHLRDDVREHSLYADLVETYDQGQLKAGSADSNDVSWITPKGKFNATARPVGAPGHTWQVTAGNAHFGKRSVTFAAKVLAGTALDLITDSAKLSEIREEFDERRGDRTYESPLPEDAEPPLTEKSIDTL